MGRGRLPRAAARRGQAPKRTGHQATCIRRTGSGIRRARNPGQPPIHSARWRLLAPLPPHLPHTAFLKGGQPVWPAAGRHSQRHSPAALRPCLPGRRACLQRAFQAPSARTKKAVFAHPCSHDAIFFIEMTLAARRPHRGRPGVCSLHKGLANPVQACRHRACAQARRLPHGPQATLHQARRRCGRCGTKKAVFAHPCSHAAIFFIEITLAARIAPL